MYLPIGGHHVQAPNSQPLGESINRNPIDKVDRQHKNYFEQNSIVSIWPNSEFGRFLFSPGSPSSIND
ncbi:predicted protein [Botrytis cinerea T4]|uniref:Uncharacterized protein n=1 Tax=Botryotinia fuckeliana (strain T4) TaxID=999810 RepID=G2YU55_BOTF4|nr:predicted protein [Botrytis cinerea T4]